MHPAIDFNTQNDCGRQVLSIGKGTVKYVEDGGSAWGGIILIEHSYLDGNTNRTKTIYSQYAHIAPLDSIYKGKDVKPGEHIAYIADIRGGNCNSFRGVTNPHKWDVAWSPHLHFEIREKDIFANKWHTATEFQNFAPIGCNNILSQNQFCRTQAVNIAGYINPLNFLTQRSYIDGAGSLVDPLKGGRCNSYGFGCSNDIVALHNHSIPLPSTGIFQIFKEPGYCDYVQLYNSGANLTSARVVVKHWKETYPGELMNSKSTIYFANSLPANIPLANSRWSLRSLFKIT